MILSYLSLFLAGYALLRFVLPMTHGLFAKFLTAAALIAASLKFQVYNWFGGFFFAPDLPRPAVLCLEWAYAASISAKSSPEMRFFASRFAISSY